MTNTDRAAAAVLRAATLFAATIAAASLQWRMVHDVPEFMYHGFLMVRFGLVPYRDFWDVNAPGTELFHGFLAATVGWTDLAVRSVDLCMLFVTAAATFIGQRCLGWRSAWCGAVLWSLVYLRFGPGGSFQRDDIVVLFLSLCLWTASSTLVPATRSVLLGLLFGAAATFKPAAAIGLPVFLAFQALDERERTPQHNWPALFFKGLWRAAAGFALPFAAVLAYLWWNSALEPFLEIATRYWPLYARLSGTLATIQSPAFNLFSGYRIFGRNGFWLLPALVGTLAGFWGSALPERRRRVWMLLSLAATFLAYVGLQGKFFGYHWHPFLYCLMLLASLAFQDLDARVPALRLAPAALLLALVCWRVVPPREFWISMRGQSQPSPKGGRVDEIAAFLESRLEKEDTVQPLDLTGGVLHAMLLAEARPATAYLYDHPFYHHVSNNYVADLRGRFLEALRRARPRFVIEVVAADKPYVRGKDTTRNFNKLRRFLETNYTEVVNRNGYVIYERRD